MGCRLRIFVGNGINSHELYQFIRSFRNYKAVRNLIKYFNYWIVDHARLFWNSVAIGGIKRRRKIPSPKEGRLLDQFYRFRRLGIKDLRFFHEGFILERERGGDASYIDRYLIKSEIPSFFIH